MRNKLVMMEYTGYICFKCVCNDNPVNVSVCLTHVMMTAVYNATYVIITRASTIGLWVTNPAVEFRLYLIVGSKHPAT